MVKFVQGEVFGLEDPSAWEDLMVMTKSLFRTDDKGGDARQNLPETQKHTIAISESLDTIELRRPSIKYEINQPVNQSVRKNSLKFNINQSTEATGFMGRNNSLKFKITQPTDMRFSTRKNSVKFNINEPKM